MTLLAPLALLGLGLLAIPIIVHLFQPRHVRQTPFSSLRWLHLTQQRMARRIQMHQVLLFLLRAGFLSLLVFALARPILSLRGQASGLDRIVVLDVSRSMGRIAEGRPNPFETARAKAVSLIRQGVPGDRTAILLVGDKTEVVAPWTSDPALYLPALEALRPTLEETRLDTALEPIRSLLAQRRPGAAVEVAFLTDNPAIGWNTAELSAFARGVADQTDVRWKLIDVSLPAPRNAWLADARLRGSGEKSVLRVDLDGVGDGPLNRTLKITGIKGVETQELPVTIIPGKRTTLELPLPSTFQAAGSLATLTLEPADDLTDDDNYYVDLSATGGSPLLLVTPITPPDAEYRPGLTLESAIRALADAGSAAADGSLQVRNPATLTAEDIAAAEVILLADAPGFPESLSSALADRVRNGGGLIMFLGPNVEFDTYNRGFRNPVDAAGSLLPVELERIGVVDAAEGVSRWMRWNDRHPILEGLLDPKIGDLGETASQRWYRFSGDIPAADEILATLADGTPAIVARSVKAGRVVIVNASADDRWCDLPRRKSFVPLVDRLLTHVETGSHRKSWIVGEPVRIALAEGFSVGRSPRIIAPSGRGLESRVETNGSQRWLMLENASEAGFYRVEDPDGSAADATFVVQPGRGDSRLASSDAEQLRAWWSPLEIDIEQPQSSEPSVKADDRVVLEPWLIATALLCLIAEMFFVHWLCPKMNPAISESHHRRKGFVAPLKERQADREREGAAAS